MSPTDVPTGDNTHDFDLSPPSTEQRRTLESALTREERDVLLNHGTEQPFCGVLLNNKRPGVYCCKLCGLPLFTANQKFESGTGWPSFTAPFAERHLTLVVDDSLGMPDDENLTGLCDLIGSLLRPPRCHDDEEAMIVLRRPGSPEISEADAHIFAQVRQAVARRETAPWAFHVAGPAGTREVTEHEARQDPAQTPSRPTRVSRRAPGGRQQPWEGRVRRGRTPRISGGPSRRNPPR